MSAYRFCRTDDIGLLVDALNRCWSPCFPGEPEVTAGTFKRSIRDLQVWCSSCMVAFSGADPIGVLIGAKRPSGTLVHRIAVHPDHRRQGHGSHLLASLSSKLAILGPPRILAEVPEPLTEASGLFSAAGYVNETVLTDYVRQLSRGESPPTVPGHFTIPLTVDDLIANGLLGDRPQVCWERSVETLTARKADITGLAVATDDGIEAYLLYTVGDGRSDTDGEPRLATAEILSLRTLVDDGGARLQQLLSTLHAQGLGAFRFPKVHPSEIGAEVLAALGFRAADGHVLYAATARSG